MDFRNIFHHRFAAYSPRKEVEQRAEQALRRYAAIDARRVIRELKSSRRGLTRAQARHRLVLYGRNESALERRRHWPALLVSNLRDPLSILLMILGVVAYWTSDAKVAVLIAFMLLLSVMLRFVQELKAGSAAEKLKAMVHTTATVVRGGLKKEVRLFSVVPGDIVLLSAGDMVPADVRIIESRDLSVNQAALTGEALPAEKHAPPYKAVGTNLFELPNICFLGTNVESGTAIALVVATGGASYFGTLAARVAESGDVSSFDKGVRRYTWLMIRFIAVMVPLVFLINGLSRGNWTEAFVFALAVAVGLTPEMLPMIVTVNLSKGALDMAKKKVIVKRLNAIQNLGAMDILCTDKTGTLTQGRVALIQHVDIDGKENAAILNYGYVNSFFQTGMKSLIEKAVLASEAHEGKAFMRAYSKVDEIPFDFIRRRMSVVVEDGHGDHTLICKGAIDEVLGHCTDVVVGGRAIALGKLHHDRKERLVNALSAEGFRCIAVAIRRLPAQKRVYTVADESDMTLLGFLAFLDPPKESAGRALAELQKHGIRVKILTGDNELVTRKICHDVGLTIDRILLGSDTERMDDEELGLAAERANVFDRLEPLHKERIIRALQKRSHVVGFLGDGINDAPALKAADVGISVDGAVDIARESSDIILLEKSLLVLKDGVREGRKVFGNIVKYIKMGASSNFGNMFSVVGGSIFLPFLPMLPLQVITNNLLYDLSQAAIPTDGVDEEYLRKPRQWRIDQIKRYIVMVGPLSSIFDYATFGILLYVFNAWTNPALFHTGWFIESLITQTLIIHIIRTKRIPFFQSRASAALTLSTLLAVCVGIWLPYSPFAHALGFVPMPRVYWWILFELLLCYFALVQIAKRFLSDRFADE